MATVSGSRFGNASEATVNQLRNDAKNANTGKSTKLWLTVWKSWCTDRNYEEREMHEYNPEQLNKMLEIFYAEVKTKQGNDYEPECLRVMLAALDRHLKDHGYPFSIVKDREFFTSKQVLEGKAKQLRAAGRGKRPNKARSLTSQEEETLWNDEKLGNKTPEALTRSMWWLLTQYFGLRGRQEHHDMKIQDFELCRSDDGNEYVQFSEGITKTRQSGLHTKHRDFKPRMFAVGGERCPVGLFKEYISRRPVSTQTSGPFYLGAKTNRSFADDIWYKVQPMGINKINTMMKDTITGTSLEESTKKFTNHSARKTLVNKLKKHHVERSSIVKVTGHRNINSLDDYDEADEEEQLQLSHAISSRNYTSKAIKENIPSSEFQNASMTSVPKTVGPNIQNAFLCQSSSTQSQEQAIANKAANIFNNCEVTVNFAPRYGDLQPRKRRRAFIDSDSESD